LVGIIFVPTNGRTIAIHTCPDKLKSRANARATRSGPVRQDSFSIEAKMADKVKNDALISIADEANRKRFRK
jgi:hypothetical protein